MLECEEEPALLIRQGQELVNPGFRQQTQFEDGRTKVITDQQTLRKLCKSLANQGLARLKVNTESQIWTLMKDRLFYRPTNMSQSK